MRISDERKRWYLSNPINRKKCVICREHIKYLSSAKKIRVLNLGLVLVHKRCLEKFENGKPEDEIKEGDNFDRKFE